MKAVKFFTKILSYLFIVVFGALCLFTAVFLMAKSMLSYDSINSYVKNANIFDYSSQEVNDDGTTLRQIIEKELLSMDVPVLTTDEILDSKDLNNVLGDYIYKYSKYLIFNDKKPSFPDDNILSIVEDTYTKNEHKQLSDIQKKNISKYITSLGDKIDNSAFDKSEANEMFSINSLLVLTPIFNSEYTIVILGTLMILLIIVISLCLGSFKRAISWCSKMIMFNGVLLVALSFLEVSVLVKYLNSHGLIDNLAILVVEKGFQNMLLYGGILIGIGILLMICSAILLKKEKSKKSSVILNDVIDSQIEDNTSKNEAESTANQKVAPLPENESKDDEPEKEEEQVEEDVPDADVQPADDSSAEDESVSLENDIVSNTYETELVPVPQEEEKLPTVVDDKPDTIDLESFEKQHKNKEEKAEKQEEPVKEEEPKQEIEIAPLKEITIEVVQPKKGKDIEYKPIQEEEEEEEIELL